VRAQSGRRAVAVPAHGRAVERGDVVGHGAANMAPAKCC
jgi:hypothetical protein